MLTKEKIIDRLKKVIDPELNINIFDLGLIYNIDINKNSVEVNMTLTSPHCPLASMFIDLAKDEVLKIKEVKDVKINLVWEPMWNPEMITKEGQKKLGMI